MVGAVASRHLIVTIVALILVAGILGTDGIVLAQERSATGVSGREVVQQARKHIGDRYEYATCTSTAKTCSCLTKVAVKPLGHDMPLQMGGQWRYDGSRKVAVKKPGDEVFFKEHGSSSFTHVGIYTGNGMMVHASAGEGEVVESPMKYIDGYFGAKRFR